MGCSPGEVKLRMSHRNGQGSTEVEGAWPDWGRSACLLSDFIQNWSAGSVLVSAAPPAESMSKSSFPGKTLILPFLFNFYLKAHRLFFSVPSNAFCSSLKNQGPRNVSHMLALMDSVSVPWKPCPEMTSRSSHHGQRQNCTVWGTRSRGRRQAQCPGNSVLPWLSPETSCKQCHNQIRPDQGIRAQVREALGFHCPEWLKEPVTVDFSLPSLASCS